MTVWEWIMGTADVAGKSLVLWGIAIFVLGLIYARRNGDD